MTMDTRPGYVSPYLIDGVTPDAALALMEEKLGAEVYAALADLTDPEALLLLALDVYRRERLLALWDDPRNLEECRLVAQVAQGVVLGLHSLAAPEQKVGGVTPVLTRTPQGDWRLGWDDEAGPVFAAVSPRAAVQQAFAWMAESEG